MDAENYLENDLGKSPYFIPIVVGAIWNLVFGGVGVLNLPLHEQLFYHSVTSEAGYIANIWFWSAVFMAGIGYGVVGFVNDKYRFFVSIGALGKIAFFIFVTYLWFGGITTDFAALIATGDLIWGLYFLYFIFRTREHGYL